MLTGRVTIELRVGMERAMMQCGYRDRNESEPNKRKGGEVQLCRLGNGPAVSELSLLHV